MIPSAMVRVAAEWFDSMVGAYIKVNFPGDAVIVLHAKDGEPLSVDTRKAVESVFSVACPVGWGRITAFLFSDPLAARNAFFLLEDEIPKPQKVPLHMDLYVRGHLADRSHL